MGVHVDSPASEPSSGARLLLAGGIGAAIALSLGIYGNEHAPATDLSITLGFADTITMKVWLASAAAALRARRSSRRRCGSTGGCRCAPGRRGSAACTASRAASRSS